VSALRLGVDAGGTGTRAVLVQDGEVVNRFGEGPLNVLLHDDAVDRLARLISESGATEAGLGLAGVRSAPEGARIGAELARRTGSRVVVGDDAEAALLGAFGGGPGIVVIAGTGSAALGQASDGRTVRVGGHGYLLGDEGGGYWIGNTALGLGLRSADRTGPPFPALESLLCKHFRVSSVRDVEPLVYAAPTDRTLLAGLVPALAESPDEAVLTVFGEAATALAGLVDAVTTTLGPLPVAMVGGVWSVAPIRARFVELTRAVDPLYPSEWGALLLLDHQETA
jgi:glucosamine kinase